MLVRAAIAVSLAATACTASPTDAQTRADARDPAAWVIGPIIRGRNSSSGMPLHPSARRGGGWQIDLPQAPGSVHYVTFGHGPLAGKRRIVLRYRIEAAPGVRIVPPSAPQGAGMITLYFQRAGDSWSGRGRFETYRWYGTFATRTLEPGTFEIVAPLNGRWTAIQTSNAHEAPGAFREALAGADQVGFVLGGGDGYGHGVHVSRGRARLVVTEFRVE
jgi:hypothetical protein